MTATGLATELGRIGQLVALAGERVTPLEHQVEGLGRRLIGFALGTCGVVGLAGILQGQPVGLMLETAITLAIAAIPEGLQVCAYRIVQEALTNSLKHAAGAATTVTLNDAGERLDLVVHTAPGAHAPGVSGAGHGLIGMAERVRVYGGSLDVGPLPDGSFRVHAQFPVVR